MFYIVEKLARIRLAFYLSTDYVQPPAQFGIFVLGFEPRGVIGRSAFVFARRVMAVSTFVTAADRYRARCKRLPLTLNTTALRALFLAVLFLRIIVQIVEFVVLRLARAALRENILVTTYRFR